MKFNIRKISAIGASLLMAGMTAGFAAAANYPAPFVSGGTADVAIVYGTGSGVSSLDLVQASNIQSSLQSFMGLTTSTTTTTSGEIVSLDSSATRIWLNTSLNTARSSLTKSDLPTVLADTDFSGNVDAEVTHSVELQAGAAAGGANSGRVIFARQPRTSDDPVIGVSIGSSATSNPLYNLSATFNKAVAFNHSDSEGEDITLFGQKFTISSDTDASDLVLLKEAETVTLDSEALPSQSVTIGGETYTVELISSSDDAATIRVTDSAGTVDIAEISEADSKTVAGLEVAIKTADETNLKLTATIILGAQKVTLSHGSKVTTGADNDPVDGTMAFLVGSDSDGRPSTITEIAVAVFRPGSSDDALVAGDVFIDPVFGSVKMEFTGLSSPLDDTNRETISIDASGDDDLTLTMTDEGGNTNTFDIVHNESGQWRLGENGNYSIHVREWANLSEEEYVVIGNEEYGHLLQVSEIHNDTGTTVGNDRIKFIDVSGDGTIISAASPQTEGTTTLNVDGKEYTVTYRGDGEDAWAAIKYPTGDASATQYVMYPTIETDTGALVALYEPLDLDLSNIRGDGSNNVTAFRFPDGDGYTSVAIVHTHTAHGSNSTWTVGGVPINLSMTNARVTNYTAVTIGRLVYNFTNEADRNNFTKVYLTNPEQAAGGANIDQPAVIMFEEKNDQNNYEAVVIDFESDPAGTSDNGAGVNDALFTTESTYGHDEATLQTNSDITHHVDWWGTLVVLDATDSDQKTASISYPSSQVYAQIFFGEEAATVVGGTTGGAAQLGDVLVKDDEVNSVSTKNLVVVGGSCINSAAAILVGGAYCGAEWTTATNVGSGQFLIKGYSASSLAPTKLALLVAGYEAADTVNAATYARTQTFDTGSEYKGTSATSAEMVTTTA